jgi:sugar transferase EpsL
MIFDRLKRLLDFLTAALLLLVLAPLLLVLSLLVRYKLGRPVLFRQPRPGLGGRIFTIYKFRTMTDERDAFGDLLPEAERLTSFGQWLRSTSLDELPELVNVLRGEMSLVGPRPLHVAYLERYTPFQARRHEVRPGITGLAQVEGRNLLAWEERFRLDVWYVDHRSPGLDLSILLRTIARVVTRSGISAEGHPTMPEFEGSRGGNSRI